MVGDASSKKPEQSFGLDNVLLGKLNWKRALSRVISDMRSDFIWAPHIRFLYNHLGEDLISALQSDLKSGTYHPGIPLTMEVPKSFRIKVGGAGTHRLGPSFTRPGSILLPKDRLLYQTIADEAAQIVEDNTDKTRSFSHRLANENDAAMFVASRKCWSMLQKSLKEHASNKGAKYIVRVDVADYFGSINQHTLINTLKGHSFDSSLAERLERMLLSYTGQKSSRGILQGLYPSDLFGAFYMGSIDRLFDDLGIVSARYVDDIYIFVASVDEADQVLRKLIPFLRTYDLNLNEVKSTVLPKSALFAEEPDLEELFNNAVKEISEQFDAGDVDTDYGFQKDWEDEGEEKSDEEDEPNLALQATEALFSSIGDFPGSEEAIERFCLPLFTKAESDYAVDYVLDQLPRRPSMTQIYASYLGKFVAENEKIRSELTAALGEETFFDWQRMWIIATLMQAKQGSAATVKAAMAVLSDANRHDALRAVAAMYVGRYGDHDRRKALFSVYKNVSEYVQLAIYFSSRHWPTVERKNARDSWGGHSQLHKMMSKGLAALKNS